MTGLRRNRLLVGLAAVALTVAGLAITPGATAESSSAPSKVDKAATGAHHCTVNLSTGTTKCFGTFRESIEHATAGRVTDGNLSARTAGVDSRTAAKLNSGGPGVRAVVIGVQYYWENFNQHPDGSTRFPNYTLTHSGDVRCTASMSNIDYRSAPLFNGAPPNGTTVNWNNTIRSFEAFGGCWQRMWDSANCTGLLFSYTHLSSDMAMAPAAGRDQTECIEWS
jgi:hypothetical protein